MKFAETVPEALGRKWRELFPLEIEAPYELQALLLRLALQELQHFHYGARKRSEASHITAPVPEELHLDSMALPKRSITG